MTSQFFLGLHMLDFSVRLNLMKPGAFFLPLILFLPSAAETCISNLSATQTEYTKYLLHWTNVCPAGTQLFFITPVHLFVALASPEQVTEGVRSPNTKLTVRVKDNASGLFYSSVTFTAWAAPPALFGESPFERVDPRDISLEWTSGSSNGFINPEGTVYEIQVSSSPSFVIPFTQTFSAGETTPYRTSVGCLTPETTYYARVRAVNLSGVPTDFLYLGSTVTLAATLPPTTFSWGESRWGLSLSPGEMSDADTVLFNETPLLTPLQGSVLPEKIVSANTKLQGGRDARRNPLPNGLVEILANHACPSQLEAHLDYSADLTYRFTSSEGSVDVDSEGTMVKENTLSFYRLDPEAGVWNKIPSQVKNGQVTATVKELGTLAVMGQEDVSLQDLRVSPNPFHQGTDTHITFANLSERATVKIFTPAGREVRRLEEADGDGLMLWDGRNSSGDAVEPGVYVYRVESPGSERQGKVMVLQ